MAEEEQNYKRIFGGIAMPSGNAPGFAVVIGETYETGFEGKHKYIFLAEAEEWDSRDLIERVCFLDYQYRPEQWIGNARDVALDKYIRQLNSEITISQAAKGKRKVKVSLSGLLLGEAKDKPFTFIVPDLNKLLGGRERNKDKQRLFLKEGSKLMTYMRALELGTAALMTFEENPAVSALAFVIVELERLANRKPQQENVISEYQRY